MNDENKVYEWYWERTKKSVEGINRDFEFLSETLKTHKDPKIFKQYIDEINTFEDQINKSIDLLQYTKRQLKSKKCQNALKKIKEEYKLE